LDQLKVEDFAPLVGQSVEVEFAAQRLSVEVAEAATIKSPSPRATPAFHIVLRAEPNWRVAQGMLRMHHPAIGAIDMFAVPIGPDSRGFCYEIVFN
jgi:hypothetical protein